jgi:uncharacterized cysteine cluster protein YcgN (CxxCxxCC family)
MHKLLDPEYVRELETPMSCPYHRIVYTYENVQWSYLHGDHSGYITVALDGINVCNVTDKELMKSLMYSPKEQVEKDEAKAKWESLSEGFGHE